MRKPRSRCLKSTTTAFPRLWSQGVLAVARLREHDLEAAVSEADAVFEKLRRLGRPTSYLFLEGYSAVVEIHLAQWQSETRKLRAQKNPFRPAVRPQGDENLRPHLSRSATPALIFGKANGPGCKVGTEKAIGFWRKSLAAAEDLNMLYEQALAHWHLARHVSDPHSRHPPQSRRGTLHPNRSRPMI